MLKRPKDDARGGLHRVVMNCRQFGNGPRLKLVQFIGTILVEINYITSDSGYGATRRVVETCAKRVRAARGREVGKSAGVIDDGDFIVGRSRGP
jgi:hypothetical protein